MAHRQQAPSLAALEAQGKEDCSGEAQGSSQLEPSLPGVCEHAAEVGQVCRRSSRTLDISEQCQSLLDSSLSQKKQMTDIQIQDDSFKSYY